MERVEVGVGSAIGMGWKRRSRARSLDIVLQYSSASAWWWVRSWIGTGGRGEGTYELWRRRDEDLSRGMV